MGLIARTVLTFTVGFAAGATAACLGWVLWAMESRQPLERKRRNPQPHVRSYRRGGAVVTITEYPPEVVYDSGEEYELTGQGPGGWQ